MSCARAAMSHASRARPAGLDRAPGASCDDIDRALGAYREHQPSRVDGDGQEGHSRKVPFPQQQGTPYSDPVEAAPFRPLATGHGRLRLIANRSGMRSCHDWLLVAGRKSMRARRTPKGHQASHRSVISRLERHVLGALRCQEASDGASAAVRCLGPMAQGPHGGRLGGCAVPRGSRVTALSVSPAQWRAASAISQCGIGPSDRALELQPGLRRPPRFRAKWNK